MHKAQSDIYGQIAEYYREKMNESKTEADSLSQVKFFDEDDDMALNNSYDNIMDEFNNEKNGNTKQESEEGATQKSVGTNEKNDI